MRKTRPPSFDPLRPPVPHMRLCDHANCEEGGEFRAPKSPNHLNEYYWFCLSHVREYNKSWDFYRGMSIQEVEASRVSDITWNRPSWPVGSWRTLLEGLQAVEGLDPFSRADMFSPALPKDVREACSIFNLSSLITAEELKKCYTDLVKRHHPDLHGGNKKEEERLKEINVAYLILKKYIASTT